MALWQLELLFVPRERVVHVFGSAEVQMTKEQWEATDWWLQHQPPSDFRSRIGSLLPTYDSWSPEILMWGSEDSDRIHVCLDDARQRVEEITARLDLRRPYQAFARDVSELASYLRCVLAAWPYHTFEPSSERIIAEVASSESARFVHAPKKYLEELSRDPNKEARGWKRF